MYIIDTPIIYYILHIHIIYIFLNISFSVYIMLLVCLLSELIIWFRIKSDVLFPRKGHLSYSQIVSATYNSFCKVKPSWAFPHRLWHVHWCHLSLAHTWVVMFVRVYMCSFWHSKETKSPKWTPWCSGYCNLSAPSLALFPDL